MSEKKKRTVAVIGSGMAGLVTAHLLHNDPQQRYQVQVLEKVRMQDFEE
jgi:2-polyprenyl-6-methoxyphenol hydroxylase-like FAD-dependent oxidoreductase